MNTTEEVNGEPINGQASNKIAILELNMKLQKIPTFSEKKEECIMDV